jgi:tRNA (guanosine-2'-O-)-methyltransferase
MVLTDQENQILAYLAQYISDHKKALVEKVLQERTRSVTVVLEDIYQSQNASAVVRTCECMGLQDIHIIENTTEYQINRYVMKGSYKWVNLIRYKQQMQNNTALCYARLREEGYTLYATTPAADSVTIHELDPSAEKIALVFGNELNGLSHFAIEQAHHKVYVPMFGFTESLNISATVAICLATLIPKLKASDSPFNLSEDEKSVLRLAWYRKMVRKSGLMEKQFLKRNV